MIAGGALGREHDRVGAVEHRVGDVARLGARGPRGVHHRLQHLGRDDDRPLVDAREPEDLLLDDRHALGRKLDAEIAARHHDGVGRGDDPFEIVDRGGVSILATMGVGLPHASQISRTRRMSSDLRTNESAT